MESFAVPVTSPWTAYRVLKAVPAGSAAIAMLTSSVTASLGQEAPTTPQDDPARLPVSQRPHPEFEPLGVRWNSLLFYPSVKTRAVFDSNVFSTAQNPQHDFAVVVSPGVTVRSQTPTASYQAEIGADIYRYNTFGSQDREDVFARLRTRNEIRRDLVFETSFEAARRHETRRDTSSLLDTKDPVPYNNLQAEATVTKTFNRFGIGLGAGIRNLTYEDVESLSGGTLDQSWRNGTIVSTTLKPFYEFSPGYRVYSRLRLNARDYQGEGDLNRDSEGYDARGGVEFPLTPIMFGSIEAGYLSQTYKNPLIEPVHGLSGGTKLTWLVTPLMTISAGADRSVAETVSQDIDARLDTSGLLKIDYELLRNLIVKAGVEYVNQDFQGTRRKDDVLKLSIGFDYLMNRSIEIGAKYDFIDRTSTDPLHSYDAHVVMFNVTAQR
jgi:hypothetical protein